MSRPTLLWRGGVYSVTMWRPWIPGPFRSGPGEGKMHENEVSPQDCLRSLRILVPVPRGRCVAEDAARERLKLRMWRNLVASWGGVDAHLLLSLYRARMTLRIATDVTAWSDVWVWRPVVLLGSTRLGGQGEEAREVRRMFWVRWCGGKEELELVIQCGFRKWVMCIFDERGCRGRRFSKRRSCMKGRVKEGWLALQMRAEGWTKHYHRQLCPILQSSTTLFASSYLKPAQVRCSALSFS